MKKLIVSFSVVLLGLAAFTSTSSAQRIEARVDGPRIVVERGRGGDRGGRLAADIERLNREVRRTREDIRSAGGGGRRIRADFQRVNIATARLNEQFRRGIGERWELRRRAEQIRNGIDRIQQRLRNRDDRRNWR